MENTESKTITLGDWMITILLLAIPFVNLILLIIWSVSESTAPSKKNFARAYLIWLAIGIILSILFFVLFAGSIAAYTHMHPLPNATQLHR
ncbi:MAG: hypothetical protein ABI443_05365 [Chthoniobacterales bacterium]